MKERHLFTFILINYCYAQGLSSQQVDMLGVTREARVAANPPFMARGCRRQRKLPCPPAITCLFTAKPTPRRFQSLSSSFCLPPSPSANPL